MSTKAKTKTKDRKRNSTKNGVQKLVSGDVHPIMVRVPVKTSESLAVQARTAKMPVGVFAALIVTSYLEKLHGRSFPRGFLSNRRGATTYKPPKALTA